MQKDYRKEITRDAWIGLGSGVGLAILGIVLTVVSYNSAEPGGTYTIWWGPVAVGVVLVLGAIWRFIRLPHEVKRREATDVAAAKAAQTPVDTPKE